MKLFKFIPLLAAVAILISSCTTEDDTETIDPTFDDKVYSSLSDYSATNYPTPIPDPVTNIWTIDDVSATANDFAGLMAALENLTSYTITIELSNMESIPAEAFTQAIEVTNMQLKVSAPKATTVKTGAFYNCYNLVSASLPKATTIEAYAFQGNSSTHYSLTSLEIASDEDVVISSISADAFKDTTLSDITLTVGESNLSLASNLSYTITSGSFEGTFNEIIIKRYSPIEITSEDDLKKIGADYQYHLLSDDYIIPSSVSDITLSPDWTLIGTDTAPFTGTFDGGGKTIKGLSRTTDIVKETIKEDGKADTYIYMENIGLFGYVSSATIKNIVIDSPSIAAGTYTGALVGYLTGDSTVENCGVTTGSLTTSTSNGHIGGLIGRVYANASTITISSCYNTASVSGTSSGSNINNVGGLIGRANTEYDGTIAITRCYNNGAVSSNSSASYLGGVVGQVDAYNEGAITITACYNNGSLSGDCLDAGGVVGLATSNDDSATVTVTSSYNNGLFSTTSAGYSGGVIGCELPLQSIDALEYKECYYIDAYYGSPEYGVGNNTSYDMDVDDFSALNDKVSSMNSAIVNAGYSDVYYTQTSGIPSLMGEEITVYN